MVCAIIRCDHLPWSGQQIKHNLLIGYHEEIRSKTGMSTSTVQKLGAGQFKQLQMNAYVWVQYVRMCYNCVVCYLSI